MKLLSVSMPQHDVNMSYYDGRTVRYIKLERTRQEKRFHFDALLEWKREAESVWAVNLDEVDDIVFSFDPSALPPSLQRHLDPQALQRLATDTSKAERLSAPLCRYLDVERGWFISHHYSHALSTWMLETAQAAPAIRVVIDGLGDGRPWSVYRNHKLIAAGNIRNGSVGWGIREAGKLLDVKFGHYNDIAGKVMGLQSHGTPDPGYLAFLQTLNFSQLKQVWSVELWYAYKKDPLIGKLTLLDWVATVHKAMGDLLVAFFKQYAEPHETISYTGGVAQNVVWNSQLRRAFPDLLIAPHCSDEGLSLGALEWLRTQHGLAPLTMPAFPWCQSDVAVAPPSEATIKLAASWLAEGKIVGWYQGHGEIGPRALGNRSMLMDPRLKRGKEAINGVKKREAYRPFGAAVLHRHFDEYFEGMADPFMLYTCQVKTDGFPAVTHSDNSSRVQLVNGANPVFEALLTEFFALTGCPLLLNTSLNLAGKPIAAFPEHALQLLHTSTIDAVIIGDTAHRR